MIPAEKRLGERHAWVLVMEYLEIDVGRNMYGSINFLRTFRVVRVIDALLRAMA